jgi:nucleotide-binding universal stress UspA family protein
MRVSPQPDRAEVLGRVQRSYPRMRRILVPLDFSGKSRQALRLAAPLAQKFGARIALVHVLHGKGMAPGAEALSLPANSPRRTAAHRRLRETALEFVTEEQIDQTIVRTGRAADEILAAARMLHVDLLAMTTEGRESFNRFFGGTAERVLRDAPCPVLTVRKV